MGDNIHISAGACLGLALLLITLPAGWIAGLIFAAAIHELSHLAAILLCGGGIMSISIGMTGAKIETLPMQRSREVLCAAAGPAGSMLFAYFTQGFPEASICAMVQSIYNLLPVFPLDGGRVARCLLPYPMYRGIEVFTLLMFSGLGLWCAIQLKLGILGIIPCCILAFRSNNRKFPCKET